jgi:hypothetical protein
MWNKMDFLLSQATIVINMGNSNSNQEHELNAAAMAEWERDCAAMDAEEMWSHAKSRPGPGSLAGYCIVQTVGEMRRTFLLNI